MHSKCVKVLSIQSKVSFNQLPFKTNQQFPNQAFQFSQKTKLSSLFYLREKF